MALDKKVLWYFSKCFFFPLKNFESSVACTAKYVQCSLTLCVLSGPACGRENILPGHGHGLPRR